ncbi:hypothetical protein DSM14862_03527 (plasmid) [Sulfitobacter indolifex]|nr:hypothetical protein DSM14862_03527 [Sulfitobacter indolifex]
MHHGESSPVLKLNSILSLGEGYLPNAVCYGEGRILGCDARNRIFSLDGSGNLQVLLSGEGYSRYRFRQPVAMHWSGSLLLVADWHNHRIVVYDNDIRYRGEFGALTVNSSGLFPLLATRFRSIFASHEYILNHEGPEIRTEKQQDRLSKRISRVIYYALLRKVLAKRAPFFKPNGISIDADRMFITQKKRRTLQLYAIHHIHGELEFELLSEISGVGHQGFGRLGNCTYKAGRLFVCDEGNSKIWIFSRDGNYLDSIDLSNSFPAFCCSLIDTNTLAIGGGSNLALYYLVQSRMVLVDSCLAGVHGMDFAADTARLYVCCRDDGTVRIYDAAREH